MLYARTQTLATVLNYPTRCTRTHRYILELEKAGFEIESVENIGSHYSLTLNQW